MSKVMNKDCTDFEASLSALIDGELEAPEQLPAIDHLLECPSCREFYHQARGLDDMVVSSQSQDADPVPEELWHRIAAESGIGRRERLWRFGIRAIGVAAAVVLAVGLLWLTPLGTEVPSPAPGDTSASNTSAGDAGDDTDDGEVDVVLEEDRGSMTEDRFLELTMEVLKADRHYHRKMLDVMAVVTAMTEEPEGSPDEPSFSLRDGVRRISLGEDDARETSIRSENRL